MGEFSIQDAAFTGFRVVREHPKALAVWALYALLLSLVFAAIIVGAMGPDFTRMMDLGAQSRMSPDEAMALFGRLAPGYLMALVVALVSNAILGAAMIRAVLLPHDDRFGFLRLGVDELRQLGLGVLTFAVFLGAYLGLILTFGLLMVILTLVAKAAAALGVALTVLGVGGGLVFLAVRLSLAPALTFDRGRIDLFGSWSLTRGRFWPLFGTYLLTIALIVVVYLLCLLVIFAIGALFAGGGLSTATARPDMRSLAGYFTPWVVAQTVLGAGVSALVWPVLFTPPTAIYRQIAASGPAAADAFF